MPNRMMLIFLLLLANSSFAAQFSAVGFETMTQSYELDDDQSNPDEKGLQSYGIWIDGGSDAYSSTTEKYAGATSFVLDAVDSATAKDNYGAIYTPPLDLSNTTSVSIQYSYLVTDSQGNASPEGGFSLEVSKDGGETFTAITQYSTLQAIKSTIKQWKADTKTQCNATHASDAVAKAACTAAAEVAAAAAETGDDTAIPAAELLAYWTRTAVISVPSSYLSKTTVLRFKNYLSTAYPKARIYLDDIVVTYQGTAPTLSADSVTPASDAVTASRTTFNYASFDSDNDWGVWQDGGRNAYTTPFLAEEGEAMALRYAYVEGEANDPDPVTGEDNGEHKPTYSSIYTKNLDMTEVEHLEIAFSFVPYNMSIAAGDHFTLSISTNSGIDFVPVKTWTAGVDFINLQRYNVNVFIPGDITSPGLLTTTTMIKIQAWNQAIENQLYIDNVNLYTIGQKTSPKGTPVDYDWSTFDHTVLQANAGVSTYDLINNTLVHSDFTTNKAWEGNNPATDSSDVQGKPGIYGAVEHTDCDHPEFGEHITQAYDPDLQRDVFVFNIHQSMREIDAVSIPDTDRCRTDGKFNDRQRVEIKTYSQSYEHQKGTQDETHFYAWRFKLPTGFQASDKFTHLHQLKPVGGDFAGMPLITLTAVGPKAGEDESEQTSPAYLNLRYSPTDVSQVTITQAQTDDLTGKWVQVLEKVTFGAENEGRYEIIITDPNNLSATPYLSFVSYSLPMWKEGGEFIRPKWGIYRSIVQGHKLRDEQVKFSDFVLLENTDSNAKYGDLISFGRFARDLENTTAVDNTDYYGDLYQRISTAAEPNDVVYLDTAAGTLKVCSALDLNGVIGTEEICTITLSLAQVTEIENAIACFQDDSNDGSCVSSEDSLQTINEFLANEPDVYANYVLWRLGKETNMATAVNAYNNLIAPQIADSSNILNTFSYVGGTLFRFNDVTPALQWEATAVAYYGNFDPCPTGAICIDLNATDSETTGNATWDADLARFREIMTVADFVYPVPATYYLLIQELDGLGDFAETSQAIDAIRAAEIMLEHWGSYHKDSTANAQEVKQALGYETNTIGVPLVAANDEELRGALAYLLFNQAFYNAIDAGTGVDPDDVFDNDDIEDFISKFRDDLLDAVAWIQEQDNSDPDIKTVNQYKAIVAANNELLDTATSKDDGDYTQEDLLFFAWHESPYLSLMAEAVKYVSVPGEPDFSWGYVRDTHLWTDDNNNYWHQAQVDYAADDIARINTYWTNELEVAYANDGTRDYSAMDAFYTSVKLDELPPSSDGGPSLEISDGLTWAERWLVSTPDIARVHGIQDYLGWRLRYDSEGNGADEIYAATGDGNGRAFLNGYTFEELNYGLGANRPNPEVLQYFPIEELLNLDDESPNDEEESYDLNTGHRVASDAVQKALQAKYERNPDAVATAVESLVNDAGSFDAYLEQFTLADFLNFAPFWPELYYETLDPQDNRRLATEVYQGGSYAWFANEVYDMSPSSHDGFSQGVFTIVATAGNAGVKTGIFPDGTTYYYVDGHTWVIWQNSVTQELVVAFKGTNVLDLGDVLRDVQAVVPTSLQDLAQDVPSGAKAGSGWTQRWKNQKQAILDAIAELTIDGVPDITFVGHSLGASTAQVAGYLYSKDNPGHLVHVEAYNSPLTGNQALATDYQAMKSTVAGFPSATGHFFTSDTYNINWDIVSKVPLGGVHVDDVHWKPRRATFNLLANHDAAAWDWTYVTPEQSCAVCAGIRVASPFLLPHSADDVAVETNYSEIPSAEDISYANCLGATPYSIYETSVETSVMIPDFADNHLTVWSASATTGSCEIEEVYQYVYANEDAALVVGVLLDDDDMSAEYGWEPLMEQDGTQVTFPATGSTHKLYKLPVSAGNELIQFIPAGALIWGASQDYGVITIDEELERVEE